MVPGAEAFAARIAPSRFVEAHTARLADGRDVMIRTASSADLAGMIDFFERLSATSRYLRFFSPQPRLRRALVEQVVAPGPDRATVLAQPIEFRATARRVVAVGGWVYVPALDRCDISIAVADEWQGQTLGTLVVLVALGAAVAAGHRRFVADVLSANARMLGLLSDLGAPMRIRHESGVARLEFELPEADA